LDISIFGLGYVGAVSLACLARDGHHVVGVDIDRAKLDLIAAGRTPLSRRHGQADAGRRRSGRAEVTTDIRDAIMRSELSLICVGTPSAPNGSQDQSAMLRLAEDVGSSLKYKSAPHTIVFRSTLVPGTVEDVLLPLLEQGSGKRAGSISCLLPAGVPARRLVDPRLRQAAVHDRRRARSSGGDKLRALFGHLPCEFRVTSIRAAEMVKYCCNNFHALKITFANETARICEAMDVDPFEVMDLVCQDRQLNISPAYLKPGFAFGGSCLPKDLRATMHFAKARDVELPMHGALLPSNRAHIDLAIAKVMATASGESA